MCSELYAKREGSEARKERRECLWEMRGKKRRERWRKRQVMKVKAIEINSNENQVTIIVIESDFKEN